MNSIKTSIEKLNKIIGRDGKTAFLSTFIIGLLTHMVALTGDFPNHDGLASMYFDQNMITSGRWFLGTACGISSFYSLPWLIGILSIFYISVASIVLNKLLDVTDEIMIVIISGLLISFPSLASNFAYVFTMDGYMIGLFLAILSVFLVGKNKLGFVFGGIALAFSMGTYQAYLPIAMLLCVYKVIVVFASEIETKGKIKKSLEYLYMGVIGVALYYLVLQVMLKIQGKVLDTYQGINGMASAENIGLLTTVKRMYSDFVSFVIKGNVLYNNGFSLVALIVLAIAFVASIVLLGVKKNWFKSVWFYVIGVITVIVVPLLTNIILVISTGVTYHLLMRYQYVFFLIISVSVIDKALKENDSRKWLAWASVVSAVIVIFCFVITDNIGYSNLQKKYEKTYAYCLRLADRIEQTEGYYQGIPIYMIGVVGEDNFPKTDITENVTDHMIGLNGDWLLYTYGNYELFYKYYMGITFNFISPDEGNYYDAPEYIALDSFPGPDATKVVDGVLYVKTENMH